MVKRFVWLAKAAKVTVTATVNNLSGSDGDHMASQIDAILYKYRS